MLAKNLYFVYSMPYCIIVHFCTGFVALNVDFILRSPRSSSSARNWWSAYPTAQGLDKSGSSKGTANSAVKRSMPDIRTVADLHQLASSTAPVPVSARLVREAAERLAKGELVPKSTLPSEAEIRVALSLLRGQPSSSSQELWKLLARGNQNLPVKVFVDFVTRLWLLSPPESVVESMASIIGEVFGEHRQLNHSNAAQELVVRWNGPSLCHADRLIKAVQRDLSAQDKFRCVRRGNTISQAMEGTVISRHRKAADQRACLWRR